MPKIKPWTLISRGSVEQGLTYLRRRYERGDEPTTSYLMELGVAYLWLHDYAAALQHFSSAIDKYPDGLDIFYEMAGVSSWCLGDDHTAIAVWRSGVNSKYADAAGGVKLPLLLYTASVLVQDANLRDDATALLQRRTKSLNIDNWPGPIAQYVLGDISEEELQNKCVEEDDDETKINEWLVGFYVGIVSKLKGDKVRFKKTLQATAATNEDDFDESKPEFLAKLWHAEFFIARHELQHGNDEAGS